MTDTQRFRILFMDTGSTADSSGSARRWAIRRGRTPRLATIDRVPLPVRGRQRTPGGAHPRYPQRFRQKTTTRFFARYIPEHPDCAGII